MSAITSPAAARWPACRSWRCGALWIDACLALCVRDDDSRVQEFDDLGLEFDLRGLDTPARRALPEVTGFDQRLRKERRKRTPDPSAPERFNAELDAPATG